MGMPAINMTDLVKSLDSVIATAGNVALGKASLSDLHAVSHFSNVMHGGSTAKTSTGFFGAMQKQGPNSNNGVNL